jgi:hypothetical protein
LIRIFLCSLAALVLAVPAVAAKKPHRNAAAAADTFALVGTPVYGGTVGLTGVGEDWAGISCRQFDYSVYGQYWYYQPGYWPTGPGGVPLETWQDTTVAYNGEFTLISDIWNPSLPAACTATRFLADTASYTPLETFEFTVPAAG